MQPEDIRPLDIPANTQPPPVQTVEDDLRRLGYNPSRTLTSFHYTATWIVTVPPDAP